MKSAGLNTVTTYVPWNLHQPTLDSFDFEGMLDLEHFIDLADQAGLLVIIRPPPYICAEWEFGGFPAWLLKDEEARSGLRSSQPKFLSYVDKFFEVLNPKLRPHTYANGGPIVAMQVENEYGSFGSDQVYLHHLHQTMLNGGLNVTFFSSNGADPLMLNGGATDDVLRTVNFGYNGDVEANLKALRLFQPTGPLFVTELWLGWFDNWGSPHQTRDAATCAKTLDAILASDASVNIYMFVGGTNFGFTNGADGNPNSADAFGTFVPITTSYDYDAPVNESGELTEKYFMLKNVISKYSEIPQDCIDQAAIKGQRNLEMDVPIDFQVEMWNSLPQIGSHFSDFKPLTLEAMDQSYGFALYRHTLSLKGISLQSFQLNLQDLHDRAMIYLDGHLAGILERFSNRTVSLDLSSDFDGKYLDILVENMGRINYGDYIFEDFKGISRGVRLDYQFLSGWQSWSLPMEFSQVDSLNFTRRTSQDSLPAFFKSNFDVTTPTNTYLRLEGWMKGVVWINGFNLGRYWNVGPQLTLFVPAPVLKQGVNEILIFELERSAPSISFVSYAMFGEDDATFEVEDATERPFYLRPIFLAVSISIGIAVLLCTVVYAVILIKRRRQTQLKGYLPIASLD